MPKQINTPNPGSGLVQQFALKGRYQPVLDEVIVPVAVVADLTPNVARARPASGAATYDNLENPGAAGEHFQTSLRNPEGSGVLVRLELFNYTPASNSDEAVHVLPWYRVGKFYVTAETPQPTSGDIEIVKGWRDSRQKVPVASVPIGEVSAIYPGGATVAPDEDVIDLVAIPPPSTVDTSGPITYESSALQFNANQLPGGLVLQPGYSFLFAGRVPGTIIGDSISYVLVWSFSWTEIPLTPGTQAG